jgi:hypothetical protein
VHSRAIAGVATGRAPTLEEADGLSQRGTSSGAAQSRGKVRELVLRLRPEIRSLFRSYGVPRPVGRAYLREAVELTVILCHRLSRPRRYLLDRMEGRCRTYWRAVMELDGDLEDPSPPEEDEDEENEEEDGGPPDT